MSLVTILLIILIILAFGGGGFLGGGAYRGPGFGLGGILLIVLIVLLATGRPGPGQDGRCPMRRAPSDTRRHACTPPSCRRRSRPR